MRQVLAVERFSTLPVMRTWEKLLVTFNQKIVLYDLETLSGKTYQAVRSRPPTHVDEVRYADAAGINNVEWDAVELPSQFMEKWLYDKATINMVSGHYQTGEPLPEDLFQQVCKARKHMAGSTMLRQLYLSALDMELHTSTDSWRDIQQTIAQEYSVMPLLPEDRFPCSFLHIFAGGYAAGYYSYKWAEVMSADAFSAFQDVGLENRDALAKVGRRFRDTVLASGGSRHPQKVFEDFRNRPPSPEALLDAYGLA